MLRKLNLVLLSAFLASTASASLVLQGPQVFQATGLGTVPTILTVQATGGGTTAYGCVASIGGVDVIGGAACGSTGIPTGTTFTQQGQTQTRLASGAVNVSGYSGGITNYSNLALVVNFSQTGQATPITLNDLRVNLTNAAGVTYTSGPVSCGSCVFTALSPGTGASGYVFTLDSAQAAAALATLGVFNPSIRVGADISLSNAVGSLESVFLGAVPAGTSPVPEPAAYILMAAGLGLIAIGRKKIRA